MTDTAAARLAAAERTAEAGTPTPWYQGETPMGSCKLDHGQGKLGHGQGECDYRLWYPPLPEPSSVTSGDYVEGSPVGSMVSVALKLREDDAALIVAARNSYAAGIAAIKAVLRGREPHPFVELYGDRVDPKPYCRVCRAFEDDPIHSPEVAAYVASLPGVTDACANCDHPDHAGWMCTALAGKDGVCTCKQAAAETGVTGENE